MTSSLADFRWGRLREPGWIEGCTARRARDSLKPRLQLISGTHGLPGPRRAGRWGQQRHLGWGRQIVVACWAVRDAACAGEDPAKLAGVGTLRSCYEKPR